MSGSAICIRTSHMRRADANPGTDDSRRGALDVNGVVTTPLPAKVSGSPRVRIRVQVEFLDREESAAGHRLGSGLLVGFFRCEATGAEHRKTVAHGVSRGTQVRKDHQPQRGDRRNTFQ